MRFPLQLDQIPNPVLRLRAERERIGGHRRGRGTLEREQYVLRIVAVGDDELVAVASIRELPACDVAVGAPALDRHRFAATQQRIPDLRDDVPHRGATLTTSIGTSPADDPVRQYDRVQRVASRAVGPCASKVGARTR
jgi:hypothetical protein